MIKSLFVFDGRSRAALQIIRSFGKRGFRVYVGNESKICASFFSKYVTKSFVYPNPTSEDFKNYIFNLIKNYKFDFIVPVRDDTTIFCSKHKNELSRLTSLLVPDIDTIYMGRDKSKTFRMAKKFDVPHPNTITLKSKEELVQYSGPFPIVLKPAISSGSRGLFIVHNRQSLMNISQNIFQEYNCYLLQDYIPGDNTEAVNVLFDSNSNCVASFSYRRVREFPRSGGPSVLRESTNNPELIKIAVNFFKNLGWKGVAMIEFKIDPRDNRPKLMEINPRFWGSLALPIFAGVDFPYLLYQVANNRKVHINKNYKIGVQARWLFLGDILWLLSSKQFVRDFKEFVKFRSENLTYDVFSLKDILPTFGAILEGFIGFFNKNKRKHVIDRANTLK